MLRARGDVDLTDEQARQLAIVTRTASALSAVGVVTIISTFCLSRHFRNPMHRLIFINAFYNAFDIVCTMISVSGPQAGDTSSLCQFQGFLNQMFPVADVLWTLVMALNVFLIVYRRYDTETLRRLEWKYMLAITAYTFIPALVFLFIRSDDKGPMYGSVTIWCAIAPKWVLYRIVCYYATIWVCIFATVIIYILVGVEISKRQRALRLIASDIVPLDDTDSPRTPRTPHNHHPDDAVAMTVEVEIDSHRRTPSTHSHAGSHAESHTGSHAASTFTVSSSRRLTASLRPSPSLSFRQYVLMPLFFFLAMLSVWVAPSTNRVASFARDDFGSFPLLVAVGITGSLRGFWNGLVFVTMGMKHKKREKVVG